MKLFININENENNIYFCEFKYVMFIKIHEINDKIIKKFF